jgi:hypothetical protein
MAEEEGFEPSVLLPEWVGLSRRRGAAERSNGAFEAVVPRREPRVRIPLPPSTSLSHREFRRCEQGGLGDAPCGPRWGCSSRIIANTGPSRFVVGDGALVDLANLVEGALVGEQVRAQLELHDQRARQARLRLARGGPTLAQCMGFTTNGLPLSLRTVGRPFDEATVLRAAYAYQRAQPGAGPRSCWCYRAGLLANEDQIAMICVSAP